MGSLPYSKMEWIRFDRSEYMQRITDTSDSPHSASSDGKDLGTAVSEKLQERLARYASVRPGEEAVSPQTLDDVKNLVAWLCRQSDKVSATVAEDGLLSVATVFPADVRLYLEIGRDGSAGATVSRSRTHAEDLPVTTIPDLTPHLVLTAVRSP